MLSCHDDCLQNKGKSSDAAVHFQAICTRMAMLLKLLGVAYCPSMIQRAILPVAIHQIKAYNAFSVAVAVVP